MMNTVLKIKLIFSCLISFILLSFQSCSEEDSVVDVAREQKVQELLRVSRALADKHEIAMCFTEQMIRGGVDTLTTEDLERAYEVYAANTVEFYVCTDSTLANANGLKLSRSSRMARETTLVPGEGGTILATYNLGWVSTTRAGYVYDAIMNLRVDWNYQGVSGVVSLFPEDNKLSNTMLFLNLFDNVVVQRSDWGELMFSAEKDFRIYYGDMSCYFMMYVEQYSFTQRIKLTMLDYYTNISGHLYLSNDDLLLTL